jgi:hypothetical protein
MKAITKMCDGKDLALFLCKSSSLGNQELLDKSAMFCNDVQKIASKLFHGST